MSSDNGNPHGRPAGEKPFKRGSTAQMVPLDKWDPEDEELRSLLDVAEV